MRYLLRTLWKDILSIFLPRRCVVCGERLTPDQSHICAACYFKLPFTQLAGRKGNGIERLFWGKIPIERASAYLYYVAGTNSRHLLMQLKYYNRPDIGEFMGKEMARELLKSDFFKDIDLIIPIPLAKRRQRKRGYNQSEYLALGIAKETGLTIDKQSVIRIKDNPTQTHLKTKERRENVRNIFQVVQPDRLKSKHVLLIDDVLTTGATLLSCAETMAQVKGVKISVLTLATARHYSDGANLSR